VDLGWGGKSIWNPSDLFSTEKGKRDSGFLQRVRAVAKGGAEISRGSLGGRDGCAQAGKILLEGKALGMIKKELWVPDLTGKNWERGKRIVEAREIVCAANQKVRGNRECTRVCKKTSTEAIGGGKKVIWVRGQIGPRQGRVAAEDKKGRGRVKGEQCKDSDSYGWGGDRSNFHRQKGRLELKKRRLGGQTFQIYKMAWDR